MRLLLATAFVLTCSAALFAGEATPLFNGKDLTGWEVHSGKATYKVVDGTIVGTTVEGSGNTFLCTTDRYCDFVLEFEVKCDKELNSGVQVRSQIADGTDKYQNKGKNIPKDRVHGYQVEICHAARGVAGGIYDEARRGWLDNLSKREGSAHKTAFKDNEWNHYKVIAQGNRIQTFVNGIPCADLTDDMDKCGIIGLQVHGIKKGTGPYSVAWKNITLRKLAPGEKVD